MSIDLTGEVATAIDEAVMRSETVVVAYVDEDDYPSVSYRGSVHVRNATQIVMWARKADEGIAKAIEAKPKIGMLYFGAKTPGAKFLSIRGEAKVDPSANDEVYHGMVEGERERDPEQVGVAIVVDVTSVWGLGQDGPLEMTA